MEPPHRSFIRGAEILMFDITMNGNADKKATNPSEEWKIIHIPERPPILPHLQPTVEVLASAIESKHANTLVRKLNHIAPLEGLRHVKRIRKTRLDGVTAIDLTGKSQLFLILCLASRSDGDKTDMPEDVLDLVNTYRLTTFTTKVCRYAASTKEEWEEQCKLWPTSFHPPTYNIEGITGFNDEDSLSVFNFMKLAVGLAKSGHSVVNAAVIVDPSNRQIIASSCDQVFWCNALTNATSMESCCSEATTHSDANKIEDKSTLLMKCSSNEATQAYHNISCLHPRGWVQQHSKSSPASWHPLRHAAIVAIENSAARDRHLFPLNGHNEEFAQVDYEVSSPAGSALKIQKMNVHVKNVERMDSNGNGLQCDSSRPYLCTGYDIYFVWEPCIMCAMAIVHQRIRRVFFAFPNPNDGALGSVHRLQGERSLNHHYAVFRVLMPEEILKI